MYDTEFIVITLTLVTISDNSKMSEPSLAIWKNTNQSWRLWLKNNHHSISDNMSGCIRISIEAATQ
jgi:hypothetical protein